MPLYAILCLLFVGCGQKSYADTYDDCKYDQLAFVGDDKIAFSYPCPEDELDENDTPTKWGLITIDGTKLIDGKGMWIRPSKNREEFLSFTKEGTYAVFGRAGSKLGVLDHNLKEVFAPEYDEMRVFGEYAVGRKRRDDYYTVTYLPKMTKTVMSKARFKLKDIEAISDDAIYVYDKKQFYFTDLEGNVILSGDIMAKFDPAYPFREGLAGVVVYNEEKESYDLFFIDKTGKNAFGKTFYTSGDYLDDYYFSEGRAIIYNEDNKFGAIDNNGDLVIDYKYDYITPFKNGEAIALILTNPHTNEGIRYRIDLNGNIIGKADTDNNAHPADRWSIFIDEETGLEGYADLTGKPMLPAKYINSTPFRNGYAMVMIDGKVQLIDSKGNIVMKNLGTWIYNFFAG